MSNQTIAAIATPSGSGGVGVIRVSGDKAIEIAKKITRKANFKPRFAHYADFYDSDRECIDQGLVITFFAPNSFTGEDVIELHGHGGIQVLQSLLQSVLLAGAQLAKPGEFSERAFLNDKIDLVQAEAIADLIEAKTQSACKAALKSLSGEFSRNIHLLQESLIELRVFVEAALDFSDEEIDFLGEAHIAESIENINQQLFQLTAKAHYGQALKDGIKVVILGKPNVGKSSLMNKLLKNDRAIVSNQAGTTRDILEENLHIHGIPIQLLDTAGLRETKDEVEKIGIDRAKSAAKSADIILWVRDASQLDDTDVSSIQEDYQCPCIEIRNKADLLDYSANNTTHQEINYVNVSAKTGEGIGLLTEVIIEKTLGCIQEESIFIARERHNKALKIAQQYTQQASDFMHHNQSPELVAEELRLAHQALGEITGEFTADDLLGSIFSSFCIGK